MSMSLGGGLRPARIHIGFLLTSVVASVLYLVGPWTIRQLVFLAVIVLPAVAILIGLRLNQIADRSPWALLVVGLGLLGISQILFMLNVVGPGVSETGHHVLRVAGYLGLVSGAALMVLRRAPYDRAGLLDAAILGLCAVGPVWELLLRPRVTHLSLAPQLLQLVEVGLMLLVAGALLRTALTATDGRVTLAYLFAGVTATLSGIVVTAWASDPVTGEYPLWVDLLWVLAYLCLAAGALHPSAGSLTVPEGIRHDETGDRRLLALAVALSSAPLLVVVSRFFAYKPDAFVLAMGTLLAIPLTMLRFRQLALRRRAAEQSLAHRAAHDELTGLPNRRAIVDAVTAGLVERRDIAVVLCELDIHTGADGDALTRAAAVRLAASLRGSDVVGRFGGHEFLVLSTGTSAREGAAIVRRLEEAFDEPFVVGEAQVVVGATVGVAVAGPHDTADSLVASADAAIYRRRRRHQ